MSFSINPYQNSYCGFTSAYNNPKQKKNMEDTQMSFVGVNMYNDGLIAFCDSKATKIDALNNPVEDKNRSAKKMLFGKDYILLCFNTNQYFFNENGIETVKNIEDYLEPKVKEYSYLELLFLLNEEINLNSQNYSNSYAFLICPQDPQGRCYLSAEITKGRVNFGKRERKSRYCWGGTGFYHRAARDPIAEKVENGYIELREGIRCLYEQAEKYGTYNPVGFPFHFAIQTEEVVRVETVNSCADL